MAPTVSNDLGLSHFQCHCWSATNFRSYTLVFLGYLLGQEALARISGEPEFDDVSRKSANFSNISKGRRTALPQTIPFCQSIVKTGATVAGTVSPFYNLGISSGAKTGMIVAGRFAFLHSGYFIFCRRC